MFTLKQFSFEKCVRHFILLLLIGILFLTSSAFVETQAQTPDPLAKRLPPGGVRSQSPQAPAGVLPLTSGNIVSDPSFESSYGYTTYWTQYSSAVGTPLCITADCGNGGGTAGPRSGSVWAWFGGVPTYEAAGLSQYVRIPACGARLQFYLWIGAATAGSGADDKFTVKIDDQIVFTANATQRSSYSTYTLVSLDVSSFGQTIYRRELKFQTVTSGQLVTFNLDDISLTGTCVMISGNTLTGGVKLSYLGGSTTSDWAGDYHFNVPVGWSGTVTPSKSGFRFTPPNKTYSNVTIHQEYQDYRTIPLYSISGNTGVGGVTLSYGDEGVGKAVTSQPNGDYSLVVPHLWYGGVRPTHPCFTFSPAVRNYYQVISNITAEDYTPAPVPAAGCSDIDVLIGGTNQGRFGLEPGASTRASFSGVNNGPVKVASTNSTSLIAAERLIYKVGGVATSFTEMMGLPDGQLDTTYWLPWYNNIDLDTQLRFANVSGSPAMVNITIGGLPMGDSIQLAAGASTRVSFAGVNAGPVKIVSDQNIVAAERLIYKANGKNTSFSEMMALPNSQLDTTYWLPWYNNVDLDTQLRFANVHDTETAQVHVYIGGVEMPNSPFTLLPGESTRKSFVGVNNGPVKIVSNVPIVAAERLIYKVTGKNTSFTEMMALPDSKLDTTYWLPWYNNADLDTQLRFANVHDTETATVHVYIGGTEVPNSPFTLLPGESTRQSFGGVNNGPVQIVSNVNIVAAERLIYKVAGVNTSFSEMMALPNSGLDTTYWLPWYNNVDLDTQLRFGVP